MKSVSQKQLFKCRKWTFSSTCLLHLLNTQFSETRYTPNGSSSGHWFGAVGRSVSSEPKDPQFESSHRHSYLLSTVLNELYRYEENKEKEAVNGTIFWKTNSPAPKCLIFPFKCDQMDSTVFGSKDAIMSCIFALFIVKDLITLYWKEKFKTASKISTNLSPIKQQS